MCRNIAIINNGRIVDNTSMRQLLSKMDTQTLVLDLMQPITHAPLLPNFATSRVDEQTLEVVVSGKTSISDLFTALAAQHI